MSSATGPTLSTIKKLFAVSRNCCAFPKCTEPLVQALTLVGEICHIRGRKAGAPRFDPSQAPQERHSADNLLLLCPLHHKIVDDDDVAYTIERLLSMKRDHESSATSTDELSDTIAIAFQTRIDSVASHGQSGGITAGVLNIVTNSEQSPFTRGQLEALTHGNRYRDVEVMNGVWEAAIPSMAPTRWKPNGPIRLGIRQEHTFQLVVDRGKPWSVDIPYSLVETGWNAGGMINLRLKGRLVLRPGQLCFESP